jgi:uncharacterized protein (TIGR03067 family)
LFWSAFITSGLVRAENESAGLQGVWLFVKAGDKGHDDESHRMTNWMADNLVVIIGNEFATVFERGERENLVRLLHCGITINHHVEPKAIDLEVMYFLPEVQHPDLVPKTAPEAIVGKTIKASYWLEGDHLRLLATRDEDTAPDQYEPGTPHRGTLHRVGSIRSGIDLQLQTDAALLFDRETKSVIPLQARPVRDLIQATLTGDRRLFQSALAKDLHPLHEKTGWQNSMNAVSLRFADDFGVYRLSDFRFRYEGDESTGHVHVGFQEKDVVGSGFDVVNEGDGWKIGKRSSRNANTR